MRAASFSTVFAAVFGIVYLIAVQKNYALFTYHPALGEFGWGVQAPRDGPAMYWYGWLATAGGTAMIAGLLGQLIRQSAAERLAATLAWVVPLAVLAGFAWLLRGYFIR